jgi:SprT protein
MPLPTIDVTIRGAVAGKAYKYTNHIELNYELINNGYFKEISEETLYHELAHLITNYLENTNQLNNYDKCGNKIKNKPHGKEWKYVMTIIGEKPEVKHNMEVKKKKYWRIEYECGCQTHLITKNKHEKILRKMTILTCRTCNKELKVKKGAKLKKC